MFESCPLWSGSAWWGIWPGSGFVFRGYKLKEVVCLLYEDGPCKWIPVLMCECLGLAARQ